jgi:hypothetical protein
VVQLFNGYAQAVAKSVSEARWTDELLLEPHRRTDDRAEHMTIE